MKTPLSGFRLRLTYTPLAPALEFPPDEVDSKGDDLVLQAQPEEICAGVAGITFFSVTLQYYSILHLTIVVRPNGDLLSFEL